MVVWRMEGGWKEVEGRFKGSWWDVRGIGLFSLIRTYNFYRLIHNKAYRILSGVYIKQTFMSFKKTNLAILTDDKTKNTDLHWIRISSWFLDIITVSTSGKL